MSWAVTLTLWLLILWCTALSFGISALWRQLQANQKLMREMIDVFGHVTVNKKLVEIEAALVRDGVLKPREQRSEKTQP